MHDNFHSLCNAYSLKLSKYDTFNSCQAFGNKNKGWESRLTDREKQSQIKKTLLIYMQSRVFRSTIIM